MVVAHLDGSGLVQVRLPASLQQASDRALAGDLLKVAEYALAIVRLLLLLDMVADAVLKYLVADFPLETVVL